MPTPSTQVAPLSQPWSSQSSTFTSQKVPWKPKAHAQLKKEQKKKLDYEDETFRQIQIFPCAKCINALISNVYWHGIYFSILMFES